MHTRLTAIGSGPLLSAFVLLAAPGTALPVEVLASVPPLAFVVNRIGGDRVTTTALIPPGAAPDSYAPAPRQLKALEDARLFFAVGDPDFLFERRYVMPLVAERPGLTVVDLSATSGAAGTVPRPGVSDPHLWLSPPTVATAAGRIATELTRLDPAGADLYAHNLELFLRDTIALDEEIRTRLAPFRGRSFLVLHPAWGAFAAHYHLVQVAIEKEGKTPSAREVVELVEWARSNGIRVVFVQRGFSPTPARVIAEEIGGHTEVTDPLAYDWIASLRGFSRQLAAAWSEDD
jgi:zinc transport system substrate-binding protein